MKLFCWTHTPRTRTPQHFCHNNWIRFSTFVVCLKKIVVSAKLILIPPTIRLNRFNNKMEEGGSIQPTLVASTTLECGDECSEIRCVLARRLANFEFWFENFPRNYFAARVASFRSVKFRASIMCVAGSPPHSQSKMRWNAILERWLVWRELIPRIWGCKTRLPSKKVLRFFAIHNSNFEVFCLQIRVVCSKQWFLAMPVLYFWGWNLEYFTVWSDSDELDWWD